jgi:hypothetical protein
MGFKDSSGAIISGTSAPAFRCGQSLFKHSILKMSQIPTQTDSLEKNQLVWQWVLKLGDTLN